MNVTDLYYSLCMRSNIDNLQFQIDSNYKIIGFLKCSKDFIPSTVSDDVFDDIVNNNAVYYKCIYSQGYVHSGLRFKTTLSGLFHLCSDRPQLDLFPCTIGGILYYSAPKMLLDTDFNILLTVCYDFNKKYKLVVSPKIYQDKIPVNRYILQKVIPEFANHHHEITIKEENIKLNNQLPLDYFDRLKNINNGYEFAKMGNTNT